MTTFNFRSTSRPILCAILGLLTVLFSEAQAAGTQCNTQECFAEHINGCEAATFNTHLVAGGRARYTVYGPPGEAGIIGEAGSFHDGLAPVKPKWSSHDEFLFIRLDGSEVFSPARDLNLKVCFETTLPEYRHGLVRLLVANDGYKCEDVNHVVGNPAYYDRAHYVYLDTSGKIVLEQRWREGDKDAKP